MNDKQLTDRAVRPEGISNRVQKGSRNEMPAPIEKSKDARKDKK